MNIKTTNPVKQQPRKIEIQIAVPDASGLNDKFWNLDSVVRDGVQDTTAKLGEKYRQGVDATINTIDSSAAFVGDKLDAGHDLASQGLYRAKGGLRSGLKAVIPYKGLTYGREIREDIQSGQLQDSSSNNLGNVGVGFGQLVGLSTAALSGLSFATGHPQAGMTFLKAAGAGFGLAGLSGLTLGLGNADYQNTSEEIAQSKQSETVTGSGAKPAFSSYEMFKNRNDKVLPLLGGGLSTAVGVSMLMASGATGVGDGLAVMAGIGLPIFFVGGAAVGSVVDAVLPSNDQLS